MEKSEHRVSRWSVSTTSPENTLEGSSNHLPPKRYMKRHMTYRRRIRYIGVWLAVMAVIIVPMISVTGEFTVFQGYNNVYINGATTAASIDRIPVWNCQPHGYLAGGPWTFLGIDVHFGRMSFAQAKTLDMIWNWVAGRGLQFFLAWLAYHVFTSALMRTAEIAHVPYGLFTSLALYSARPGCLWDIGKGLLTIRGMRINIYTATFA